MRRRLCWRRRATAFTTIHSDRPGRSRGGRAASRGCHSRCAAGFAGGDGQRLSRQFIRSIQRGGRGGRATAEVAERPAMISTLREAGGWAPQGAGGVGVQFLKPSKITSGLLAKKHSTGSAEGKVTFSGQAALRGDPVKGLSVNKSFVLASGIWPALAAPQSQNPKSAAFAGPKGGKIKVRT